MTEEKKESKSAKFNKVSEKLRIFVAFSFLFVSLVVAILGGALDSSILYQDGADYIAKTVDSDLVEGDYLSLVLESSDESEYPMPTSYNEFVATYGTFKERKAYYASTVNADKKHAITLNEIPNCPNLSVLYANVHSNKEYNGHYKQEYYPTELMFEGNHDRTGATSFLYVSQSQADIILKGRGVVAGEEGYTEEQYESLLGTHTTIAFDGEELIYNIGNVYLEQNYYYEALTSVMGNFICSHVRFPNGFEKQSLYFLNDYEFQNEYYMKRINEVFSSEHYSARVNLNNVTGDIDQSRATSFFYNHTYDDGKTAGHIVLIVLACLSALISLFLCWRWLIAPKAINILIMVPFALSPYLILKLIYLISGNTYIFSPSGLLTMSILLMIYLALYAFLSVWKWKGFRKKR